MVLDVQSLGLECLLGSGAVARYVSVAAVFPIILMWPLRSIEGMSRPRRSAQIIAGHGGPLQHFHGRFVFPWLSVSFSKSLSLRHDSKMTASVMEMKCKRLMTGH